MSLCGIVKHDSRATAPLSLISHHLPLHPFSHSLYLSFFSFSRSLALSFAISPSRCPMRTLSFTVISQTSPAPSPRSYTAISRACYPFSSRISVKLPSPVVIWVNVENPDVSTILSTLLSVYIHMYKIYTCTS